MVVYAGHPGTKEGEAEECCEFLGLLRLSVSSRYTSLLSKFLLKTNRIQNYSKQKGEQVGSTSLVMKEIFQKDLFLKIGEISTINLDSYGCAVSTLKFSVETSLYLIEMVVRNVDPIKWYKVRIPFVFSCLCSCA